ncbi:MAG: ABC transporter substrate-binding protein, partial [Candidatus Binataceae bacterium]
LDPAVTETIFALGAGGEVVGVSQYTDYPPQAVKLPKVGTFLTPNIEAIVALRPTLIVGPSMSADQREIHALRAMGYPILMVNDNSIAGIEESIERIGDRIGLAPAAHRLLLRIRDGLATVSRRLKHTPPARVLMVVGHQPIVAAGRGTYLDELIKRAHGDNIADAAAQQWPRLSLEYIIAARPQVILDGQMGTDAASPDGFWSNYPSLPAVRHHRVCGYPDDPVLHPGPRIARSLAILARLIHPEAFRTLAHASTHSAATSTSLAATETSP